MAVLPSLAALRAFEATFRLGGLARAAAELNVSTRAVSHQVRGLEDNLGTRLLDRPTGVGGVCVTPTGARLLAAASGALSLLEEACEEIWGISRRLTVSANVRSRCGWRGGWRSSQRSIPRRRSTAIIPGHFVGDDRSSTVCRTRQGDANREQERAPYNSQILRQIIFKMTAMRRGDFPPMCDNAAPTRPSPSVG
jgi:hypothetical protein